MLRKMGLSSFLALSNASAPHGYQSIGLSLCWSRYGEASIAKRFGMQQYGQISLVELAQHADN